MPAETFSCENVTASYELAFETTPGAHPSLLAYDRECGGVAITVCGKVQPPLKASFASTAAKLLGFQHAR